MAVFTLVGPSVDTGSDPTSIPLSAVIAPEAGMLLTRFLAEFAVDVGAVPDPARPGTHAKDRGSEDTPDRPGV